MRNFSWIQYTCIWRCVLNPPLHKRGARFTESPYCQALSGASPTQLFVTWLISNPQPISPLADLWQTRCIRGQQDRSDSWLCPFPSTRKSYLSQSTTPAPALQNSVRNKSYFAQWVKGQNEVSARCVTLLVRRPPRLSQPGYLHSARREQ